MNWEDLKEKLSPAAVGALILYLVAGVIVAAYVYPHKAQVQGLEDELRRLSVTETALTNTLAQLPSLEKRKAELMGDISELEEQIPTQYDLPQVLEFIRSSAAFHNLTLARLEHFPVSKDPKTDQTLVSLELGVVGEQQILGFVSQIQEQLPTFSIKSLVLGRADGENLLLEMEGDLYLKNGHSVTELAWQIPDPMGSWLPSFSKESVGWPYLYVQSFANGGFKVVGVVEAQGERSALVVRDGERQWVKQGDFLGQAQVLSVDGKSLRLALGTAEFTLKMGE